MTHKFSRSVPPLVIKRSKNAPQNHYAPPKPEVLPTVDAKEQAKREKRDAWLRAVLEAGDD